MKIPRARMLRLTAFVVSLPLMMLAGCSSGPATLTLKPDGRNVSFAQTFTQAYCGKTRDGSYNCVLVSDDSPPAADEKAHHSAKGPLEPVSLPPLRQVVNIRVLWRPMNGMRDSVASNATIDWYVLSNTSDGSDDLLLYQGSGYVTLEPDDDTTKITVRSADLRPAIVRGNLTDPIGNATMNGVFVATNDNDRTIQLINAARERTAAIASGH
jgi:hypothetical protein